MYDGDTITVDIDLGLGVWVRGEKIRLHGINAPEVRGDQRNAGLKSRDYLRDLILGKEVFLETTKDKKGKYGRYLADVYIGGSLVQRLLVEGGYAVYKDY